ncbi:phytoene desaturase family protein [Thermodesulfobacteriota bacterium]
MEDKWDAIIIGAGMSGLSVGALLANSGARVLILEKGVEPGGRNCKIEYNGFTLDNGLHAFGREGYLEDVFEKVGKPLPNMRPIDDTYLFLDGDWKNVKNLVPRDKVKKIYKEILETPNEKIEALDDVSLKEWVGQRTSDEILHRFFCNIGQMYLVANKYELISASEVLFAIKDCLLRRGSQQGFWIDGGDNKFILPLVEAVQERGGEIRLGVRVDEIIVKNGVTQGIAIEKPRVNLSQMPETDEIKAPIIISTLPLWDLFSIVSEEHFPVWYTDWVKSIMHRVSYFYTLFAGLKKPLWKEGGFKIHPKFPPTGLFSIFTEISNMDKTNAPDGKGFMICTTQGYYDEFPNLFDANQAKVRRDVKRLFDRFEEGIDTFLEGFKENRLWTFRHAARYSIAQEPGMVGKFRPGAKPPEVKGLYLASDTIRTRGVGINSAACAALNCFDRIREDHEIN